ncbi:hypothetical protein [Actinopolyspora halophila]|uniref:hypothetical protein n=1 Tax=Actinopolyspora halophila TaxID=1850 RepID=UPI000368080F|nr:hypothetical protein [Actinopolyspora halophila]
MSEHQELEHDPLVETVARLDTWLADQQEDTPQPAAESEFNDVETRRVRRARDTALYSALDQLCDQQREFQHMSDELERFKDRLSQLNNNPTSSYEEWWERGEPLLDPDEIERMKRRIARLQDQFEKSSGRFRRRQEALSQERTRVLALEAEHPTPEQRDA